MAKAKTKRNSRAPSPTTKTLRDQLMIVAENVNNQALDAQSGSVIIKAFNTALKSAEFEAKVAYMKSKHNIDVKPIEL